MPKTDKAQHLRKDNSDNTVHGVVRLTHQKGLWVGKPYVDVLLVRNQSELCVEYAEQVLKLAGNTERWHKIKLMSEYHQD